MRTPALLGIFVAVLASSAPLKGKPPAAPSSPRELQITVEEVSQPTLTLSPDGQNLAFSLLGDLVALSLPQGKVEILTRGPAFDASPRYSLDGEAIYFVSDRADDRPDIYRLDLETLDVTRITTAQEPLDQLAIAPDGSSYVARVRAGPNRGLRWRTTADNAPLPVRLYPGLRSPSFLQDGSLIVVDPSKRPSELNLGGPGRRPQTVYRAGRGRRIESANVSPSGRYAVCRETGPWNSMRPEFEEWVVVDLENAEIMGRFPRGPYPGSSRDASRAALSEQKAYLPIQGKITVFDLETKKTTPLKFHANVTHTLPPRSPRKPPGLYHRETIIQGFDAFSPTSDGSTVIFSLHGDLYRQGESGTGQKLTSGPDEDRNPALSKGEGEVVFTRNGTLCTLDLETLEVTPTDMEISRETIGDFSLHPGGSRLVTPMSFRTPGVVVFDLENGERAELIPPGRRWMTSPSWSGESIVFLAEKEGIGQVYTLSSDGGDPEPITAFTKSPRACRSSPDGRWLGILRDGRGWIATRKRDQLLKEDDFHPLGSEGADRLRFSRDSRQIWTQTGGRLKSFDCSNQKPIQSVSLTAPPEAETPPPLTLVGGKLLDLDRGTEPKRVRIEIRDRRIASVHPDPNPSPVSARAKVLDVSGSFILPGLFDLHVHDLGAYDRTLLAHGVTTARQLGAPWYYSAEFDERVAQGSRIGPRLLSAGEIFEGPRPNWFNFFHIVETADEALFLLEDRASRGLDLVKIYPTLPRKSRRSLLHRADELGIRSTLHISSLSETISGIVDGIEGLEHVLEGPVFREDVLKLMAAAEVTWCPTLTVRGVGDSKFRIEREALQTPRFRRAVPSPRLSRWTSRPKVDHSSDANLSRIVEVRSRMLVRAIGLGIDVVVGSDASVGNAPLGPSTHWEIESLVRGGLSPAQALRHATIVPATVTGLTDRGRISPGLRADILILEKNPLEDIRHLDSVTHVIRGGHSFVVDEILDPDL